jgi:peptidoglycan biosynthesis protein MviN/MurJ (putative lipid II flippase)
MVRTQNMMISLVMLALEAGLAAGLILVMQGEGLELAYQATGPAIGLCVALAFASVTKASLLKKELGAPVLGLRWDLLWATGAGAFVGAGVHYWLPQPLQLVIGVPAILIAFFVVLWTTGFGPEDRELFRMRKAKVQELRDAEDAADSYDRIT